MLQRKEFFSVLHKAVPPDTTANKALGGILINLYDEIERLQRGAFMIAKKVSEVETSPPAQDAQDASEETPDEIVQGAPLSPDITRAMEAANVAPDGEPLPSDPKETAPVAASPASQGRSKKNSGGGK